jgi:hypothetical protein
MSDAIDRPFVLMRHHAGWADVFHVHAEAGESVTGAYVDRETFGGMATYSTRAILARFATLEAARAARDGAALAWREHDDAIRDAEANLRAVERTREAAWLTYLTQAAG